MASLTSISPQFLVADLSASVRYYVEELGFEANVAYQDFYSSVRRDGVEIHLKVAESPAGDRAHRRDNNHLDAYFVVDDVRGLFEEFSKSGARIFRALELRPWGVRDFCVEDLDGYILCFGQPDG